MARAQVIFLLSVWLCGVSCEVFTAIAEMAPLLRTHDAVIRQLASYLDKEHKRTEFLTNQLELYRREHEKALSDIPNYLGNPINAFTLIKRLTKDLEKIESFMHIGSEYDPGNTTTEYDNVLFPSDEDLVGAAAGLARLKNYYNLDTREMAEGKLNGVLYSAPMSASDCLELGRSLHKGSEFKEAASWLEEAERKNSKEQDHSCSRREILEALTRVYNSLGEANRAFYWSKQLLLLDPHNSHAINYIPKLNKHIVAERHDATVKEEITSVDDIAYDQLMVTLKALCRGDITINHSVSKRLKCRYVTENHPFLKLAPIKLEEMYLDPDVYVFHDVVSEREMEHIKETASSRLYRALVRSETGEPQTSDFRISKLTWMSDEESDVIAKLSRRIVDMTGLNLDYAEPFQIANYGIGGHYDPHIDFISNAERSDFPVEAGNRLATVIYYISDVEQGGATVFPRLGVRVAPKKGSALFWMNLHPSGEGDDLSVHAACPVLRGSKWICNKWLHSRGHELIRPCNLEFQPEGISEQVPAFIPAPQIY